MIKKLAILFIPFLSFGAGILSARAASSPINSAQDIISVLDKISVWVATVFWIAAAVAVFYAAYLYLTANDSEEKIGKAHKQLIYAIIGIAVGLMAYGMPTLVRDILTPGGASVGDGGPCAGPNPSDPQCYGP